jgi:hypothetical protein
VVAVSVLFCGNMGQSKKPNVEQSKKWIDVELFGGVCGQFQQKKKSCKPVIV